MPAGHDFHMSAFFSVLLKFTVDYSRMLTAYYNPTALYMSERSITPAVSNRLNQQNGLLMSAVDSIFFRVHVTVRYVCAL